MPQLRSEPSPAPAVPEDLAAGLRQAGLTEAFFAMPPSHRREYILWIEEAKRPETRQRRIGQTLLRLNDKKPDQAG